ncbi:unnamed protein product [Amaranthus hypochondriacus]
MAKSHLQCYGELVYCVNKDMLSNCAKGKTSIDRMISVVGWIISTVRMFPFGVAPYNSVLGETHHASRGTLNVLLEQVSHHPPVSALHAIDEANNIELVWCEHTVPKFYGAYVEGVVHGKRKLNLLDKGESYVFNAPTLLIKFIPKTGTRWAGNVNVKCKETGLEAQLSFKTGSALGFGGDNGSLNGRIFSSSSSKIFYEIYGHWDRMVYIKDTKDGMIKVLYNPKEVISNLPTPIIRDPKGLWESESAIVWAELNKSILSQDWNTAKNAKKAIEEKERELLRLRKSNKQEWIPKFFDLSYSPETGWECSPKQKTIPPAPIIFPI